MIRVDAIPTEENGSATTQASGPATVPLTREYSAVRSIAITPQGTSALTYAVDNIIVGDGANSFDVYIFDGSGAQVARPFLWSFKGV